MSNAGHTVISISIRHRQMIDEIVKVIAHKVGSNIKVTVPAAVGYAIETALRSEGIDPDAVASPASPTPRKRRTKR